MTCDRCIKVICAARHANRRELASAHPPLLLRIRIRFSLNCPCEPSAVQYTVGARAFSASLASPSHAPDIYFIACEEPEYKCLGRASPELMLVAAGSGLLKAFIAACFECELVLTWREQKLL